MAPFYGWGSTAARLEPLRGGSLIFTTKFPEIPGTHFINLGWMNGNQDMQFIQFIYNEIFAKIVNSLNSSFAIKHFRKRAASQMFDRILNKPLTRLKSVFKNHSKICDGAFRKKSFSIDVRIGSKYVSDTNII